MEEVSVISAPLETKDTVRVMLSVYLAELGVAKDYPYFDMYWQEQNERYPRMIRFGANNCGFAFVRAAHQLEIAEFYVAPEYRRAGVGRKAVIELLTESDGAWSVRVLSENDAGLSFWRAVLKKPLVKSLRESRTDDGIRFDFFSFERNDV